MSEVNDNEKPKLNKGDRPGHLILGVKPKREDIPDRQNAVKEFQGHMSNGKQRAKAIGNRNIALKNKLKAKPSKLNRNKSDFAAKRARRRKIKREGTGDIGARSKVGSYGLINRNWQRISIHPFINFLRVFRRKVPNDCPLTVMKLKGREIWRKMDKQRKYPFVEQAIRAKQKRYTL